MTTRRRQVAWLILGMVLMGVVVGLIFAILTAAQKSTEIRDTQESRIEQVESNDKTLAIIEGCTTPGEPCYERGRRQTASAVGNINRVVILAAACASGGYQQTADDIQACVIARLAEKKR